MSRPWVVAACARDLPALEPLLEAHRQRGPVRVVVIEDPDRAWPTAVPDAGTLLVVGAARRGPRTVLPGVVVLDRGRPVVAGRVTADVLTGWVPAAVQAATRAHEPGVLALLASREPRAVRALDAVEGRAGPPYVRWDASRLTRRGLVEALAAGPAVAVYLGTGAPGGWFGYGGVTAPALRSAGPALGLVLSLTCATASRSHRRRAFGEELLADGTAATVLAAPGLVRHTDDVQAAAALAAAHPRATVDALLLAAGLSARVLRAYRLLGDPGAPLYGGSGAQRACRQVWAPAPSTRALVPVKLLTPATASCRPAP